MERAEQEVVARRARRVLWGFRALFYGGAAVVAALLLTGGGEEPETFLEGRTAQDRNLTMKFEHGRPASVGASLAGECDDGEPWTVRWWSFDGKTARFRFDDGVLRIGEKLRRQYDNDWFGDRSYTLEARVEDERVTGSMRYVEVLRHASGTAYTCESGDVSFSAG